MAKTLNIGTALLLAIGAAGAAAAGDPAAGEKAFKKCAACHQLGENGKNRAGPILNGVVGQPAGQVEGFKYSNALLDADLTWDEATLGRFLGKPKDVVAGTKMSFAGLKDDGEISDVIALLATYNPDGTRK